MATGSILGIGIGGKSMQTPTAPSSESRVGQAREELSMLFMEADRLEASLRSLYERIEPIICNRPQPPDQVKEAAEPTLCTHAKELRSLRSQLYRITETVQYVTSIVEV